MKKNNEVIYSNAGWMIWMHVAMTLVCLLLTVFLGERVYHIIVDKEEYLLLFMLFAPLGVVIGSYHIYRHIRSRMLLGKLPLRINPAPGSIGGDIGGSIECKATIDESIELVLSCMKSEWTGSGDSRSLDKTPIWQRNGYARVQSTGMGSLINFCFKNIPADLEPTQEMEDGLGYAWTLELKLPSSLSALDFTYNIPVEVSHESSTAFNFSSDDLPEVRNQRGIKNILPFTSDTRYVYGYFQTGLFGWVFLIMGLMFGGMGVFVGYQAWIEDDFTRFMMAFMSFIFFPVGCVMLILGLLTLLTKTQITLQAKDFVFQQYLMGFSTKHWRIPYRELTKVESQSNGSSTTRRGGYTKYYKVMGHFKREGKNKKIPLAMNLNNTMHVEDVVHFYKEKAGIE